MKSIGLKLWAGMMLLVVFMLIVLWLFQIVFLEKFYMTEQIDKLEKKSQEIVQELSTLDELSMIAEDEQMTKAVESFVYTYHLNIELLDKSGHVLYQMTSNLDQHSPKMFKKSSVQVINQVVKGDRVQTTFEHPRFGNTMVIIGLPIMKTAGVNKEMQQIGALVVNAPMAPVSDTADILKQQLLYITVILLIAAFGLAFMISRHLSKPILKINQAAKEIAKGKWDVNVQTNGSDEIGQLGLTIKEMAGDLKRTDQLQKELIGNISHELRTPLSLIRGYAETIRDVSGVQPEKREKHVAIIIHESERLARLIDDILNLSQLEAGIIKLDKKCINLRDVLDGTSTRFSNLAESNNIELIVSSEEFVYALGDRARIEQVLINLVGNAFNHTSLGGKIEIITTELMDGVKIEVKDNGKGIPDDELSSIWERYYKVKNQNRDQRVGSGLGLVIVKNILTAHESKFGVESTLGEGATFWFTLKKCK